jgi:hypothetical protein
VGADCSLWSENLPPFPSRPPSRSLACRRSAIPFPALLPCRAPLPLAISAPANSVQADRLGTAQGVCCFPPLALDAPPAAPSPRRGSTAAPSSSAVGAAGHLADYARGFGRCGTAWQKCATPLPPSLRRLQVYEDIFQVPMMTLRSFEDVGTMILFLFL